MTANRQEVSDQTTQPNETIDEPFHIASEAEFRQQLDDKLKNNPEFPSGLRSQDLPHDFSEQLGHDLDRNLRVANTAVREDALEETGHAFVKDLDKEIKDRSKVDFSSIIADLEKRIEEAGNEKVREALAIELGMYQGLETRNIETIKLYEDAKQAYREQQAKNARKKAEFQASHERLSQIRSAIEELSQANKSLFPDARDAHISLAHATSEIKTAFQIRDEQETILKSNNEFDPEEEEILSDEHVAKMNDFQTAEFLLKEAQQAFAEAQTRQDEILKMVNDNLDQIKQLRDEAASLEKTLVSNYLDNSEARIAKLQKQLRAKGVDTGPGPEVSKEEIKKRQELHVSLDTNPSLEAEGAGEPESLATTQPTSQAPTKSVPSDDASSRLDSLVNPIESVVQPESVEPSPTVVTDSQNPEPISDPAKEESAPNWLQEWLNEDQPSDEPISTGVVNADSSPEITTPITPVDEPITDEPPISDDDTKPTHPLNLEERPSKSPEPQTVENFLKSHADKISPEDALYTFNQVIKSYYKDKGITLRLSNGNELTANNIPLEILAEIYNFDITTPFSFWNAVERVFADPKYRSLFKNKPEETPHLGTSDHKEVREGNNDPRPIFPNNQEPDNNVPKKKWWKRLLRRTESNDQSQKRKENLKILQKHYADEGDEIVELFKTNYLSAKIKLISLYEEILADLNTGKLDFDTIVLPAIQYDAKKDKRYIEYFYLVKGISNQDKINVLKLRLKDLQVNNEDYDKTLKEHQAEVDEDF